jgi:hypothetical protein
MLLLPLLLALEYFYLVGAWPATMWKQGFGIYR